VRPRAPRTKVGVSVEAVRLETPELFTLEEGNPVWELRPEQFADHPWIHTKKLRGAYLRLEPPEQLPDATVEALKQALLSGGAAAVRAMPRRRRSVVPQAAVSRPAPQAPRAAAMALVDAANTQDRDALRAAVEQALAASWL
jgi:hypothetical protein